jgi:nucleotide-binding universal stress UspA family protein
VWLRRHDWSDTVINRILVGVDGSAGSCRALRWAIEEAAAHRAAVQAVIVWQTPYEAGTAPYPGNDDQIAKQAQEQLMCAIARVGGQRATVIEALVVEGEPAQTLSGRSADADLLVVGSHGQGGSSQPALGSVSAKCANNSHCPVVIVPGDSAFPGYP